MSSVFWFVFQLIVHLQMLAIAEEGVLVEGIVTYDGPVPAPIPVAEAGIERELVEVDFPTKGLKDAVVWVETMSVTGNEVRQNPAETLVMDQQNFCFFPHVLSLTAGQKVEFRNSDVANHGVIARSLEPKNQFNRVTPPGGTFTHPFAASKHAVAIGCPLHSAMAAWIYVFDHPYHAVTDVKGRFKLPSLPVGHYRLRIHHIDGKLQKAMDFDVENEKPVRLNIQLHELDRQPA